MKKTPSIQELNETIYGDLRARLGISDDDQRKVLTALSAVLAGQFKLMYLRLADIQNNVFPDTADLQANGGELERHGQIQLNRNINPATAGVFTISLNAIAGSVIRSGLTFKSNDVSKNPGQLFVTDAEYICTGTDDVIEIRSLGGGVEYDLDVADTLTITEPVIGVDKTVTVTAVVEQPKAAESIADYRQSILDAIQLEPQGGARTDYMIWAKDAQGVRRVYPYVKESDAGVIELFVEATTEDSTDGEGTPSAALLADVVSVINFDPDTTKPTFERGRRPAQAYLDVKSITLVPVDIDITALNTRNTAIETALFENLQTAIRDVRPYMDGADLARNKNNILYAAKMQSVVTDVLDSSNYFQDFVLKVSGVPQTSYEFSGGNIPYLRTVNYL